MVFKLSLLLLGKILLVIFSLNLTSRISLTLEMPLDTEICIFNPKVTH